MKFKLSESVILGLVMVSEKSSTADTPPGNTFRRWEKTRSDISDLRLRDDAQACNAFRANGLGRLPPAGRGGAPCWRFVAWRP